MNDVIRNNEFLTQEAESMVYKSTICPVASYASETKPARYNGKRTTDYRSDYVTEEPGKTRLSNNKINV